MLEMKAVQSYVDHLGSVSGDDGSIDECGVVTDMGREQPPALPSMIAGDA